MEFDWERPEISPVEAEIILGKAREAIKYVVEKLPYTQRPDGLWIALLSISEESMAALCEAMAKHIKERK